MSMVKIFDLMANVVSINTCERIKYAMNAKLSVIIKAVRIQFSRFNEAVTASFANVMLFSYIPCISFTVLISLK